MCGFAGEFVFAGDGRADAGLADRMASRLAHRGPDEDGSYVSPDGRCAIGFRRLAVIDPPLSHQPMCTPDGRAAVAFNGEIYNFRALRNELAAQGSHFATRGDTEVLLHLYRREGEGMVQRLAGMFAYALYDRAEARLFLARDRLGQKPLWYARLSDRVAFASEPKALLAHPRVDLHPDRDAITAYIAMGYVPGPRSAWRGLRKLGPGHVLTVDRTGVASPQPYWHPQPIRIPPCREDQIEQVRRQLAESVESRMVSDVPLGALLSGGVDSSIIVALMCRAAGEAGGIRTFSAGFADAAYDERPAARRVARHCGTDHRELLVEPRAAGAVDELVDLYDEPFADSSALPTLLICRAARQHVTVALVGDGGDEVFGGYDRYRALHLSAAMGPAAYAAVRLGAWLVRPLASQHERARLRRLVRFADALPEPPALQYLAYRSLFTPQDLRRLLTDDWLEAVDVDDPADWFCSLYEEADLPDEVARAQRHDMLTYLPDDLLVKADIASMAASLELRAPMLDHPLVRTGLSLPPGAKLNARRGKLILREAFGDLLPAEVFRRRKRGFGVPLARWFREDLRETLQETLLDASFLDRGICRPEAIAGLVEEHLRGRADHSHRLWALVFLARWLERQG